ncbi:uncharacterized protein LOC111202727 isoform X2 [Brassica napus]|uniref:uncharacterized protein LOC111202727 isoform X2 n=1 Tax=Brassica napus TaxID=3708 RepID=UPI00207ACBB6|nr:uncharacterized protein LOC111202727 isoform X2 [Brassica napus]
MAFDNLIDKSNIFGHLTEKSDNKAEAEAKMAEAEAKMAEAKAKMAKYDRDTRAVERRSLLRTFTLPLSPGRQLSRDGLGEEKSNIFGHLTEKSDNKAEAEMILAQAEGKKAEAEAKMAEAKAKMAKAKAKMANLFRHPHDISALRKDVTDLMQKLRGKDARAIPWATRKEWVDNICGRVLAVKFRVNAQGNLKDQLAKLWNDTRDLREVLKNEKVKTIKID